MRYKIVLVLIAALLLWIAVSIYHSHQQSQCLEQNGVWDAQHHECTP